MVNEVYLGCLLWVHIVCNIELESVSAAVRADINLNKIFFPRERYVVDNKNCLTDTLIRVLRLCRFYKI